MSMAEEFADPAKSDRRRRFVGGFHEFDVEPTHGAVPGFVPGPQAKLLSKDMAGGSTHLVWFPGGWQGGRGSFSGRTDIFVVSGEMICGGGAVGSYDTAAFNPGQGLELFAPVPTIVLIFTQGPVSFHRGGTTPEPFPVFRFGEGQWLPASDEAWNGTLEKPLLSDRDRDVSVRIRGIVKWTDERWRSYSASQEWFLLEGDLAVSEWLVDGPVRHRYEAGGYLWRPAGVCHGGASSGTESYALLLERTVGQTGDPMFHSVPCSYPDDLE